MSDFFFVFVSVLFLVAIILGEDYVFVLLYLVLGAFILGNLWGKKALGVIAVRREFNPHAFLGERVAVHLRLANTSFLPLAWLQIHESLPVGMSTSGPFQQVVTLGPKAHLDFDYNLNCLRRGYYAVGPLVLHTGDVLGAAAVQSASVPADHLTVFPRIVPLTRVKLPSSSPLGALRTNQPAFEDPSRVLGKRDYLAGDSLRRIDWKASAVAGRLQVKLFEPSIALETAIFLNLNSAEYEPYARFDASELAIVVAASLANWIISVRQSVGLVTNGADPLADECCPRPLSPRGGRNHLLHILEVLARLHTSESQPFTSLIQQEARSLSWGTTLILITNRIDDALLDVLFQARRTGLSAFLVQCGPGAHVQEARQKSAAFGFPFHQVYDIHGLDQWRQ